MPPKPKPPDKKKTQASSSNSQKLTVGAYRSHLQQIMPADKGKGVAKTTSYLKAEDYAQMPIQTLQGLEQSLLSQKPFQLADKPWTQIVQDTDDDQPLILTKSQLQEIISQKK